MMLKKQVDEVVAAAFFFGLFIVQDEANLIVSGPQSVNISSGEHAYFNCTATATYIRWEINNEIFDTEFIGKGFRELPPIVLNQSQNLLMERLKVQASAIVDNFTLACVAFLETSPEVYVQNRSGSALLRVQGPLQAVINLTVVSINSTTVLISWSPPFTLEGVPILGYNVTITNTTNGENETMSVEGDTTMLYYSIDHPDPDNNFTVTVVPINGPGPGQIETKVFSFSSDEQPSSVLSLSSTKPESPTVFTTTVSFITSSGTTAQFLSTYSAAVTPAMPVIPPSTFNDNIGVIIGLAVGLVILVLIVTIGIAVISILICLKRSDKEQPNQSAMASIIVPTVLSQTKKDAEQANQSAMVSIIEPTEDGPQSQDDKLPLTSTPAKPRLTDSGVGLSYSLEDSQMNQNSSSTPAVLNYSVLEEETDLNCTEASVCSSRPLTHLTAKPTSQSAVVVSKCSGSSQQDHDQPIPETNTDIESYSKVFVTPYSKTVFVVQTSCLPQKSGDSKKISYLFKHTEYPTQVYLLPDNSQLTDYASPSHSAKNELSKSKVVVVPRPHQRSSSQVNLVSGLVETSQQAVPEYASYPLSPTNVQAGYYQLVKMCMDQENGSRVKFHHVPDEVGGDQEEEESSRLQEVESNPPKSDQQGNGVDEDPSSCQQFQKENDSLLKSEAPEVHYAELAEFDKSRPKPTPQVNSVQYATTSAVTQERMYGNVGDQKRQAKQHGVPSDEDIALISQQMAHKWRLVGLELGVDPAVLDQIASKCGSDQSLCCSKLFMRWSAREITTSCPFTWKAVIETLDSEYVRESSLARSLESTIIMK